MPAAKTHPPAPRVLLKGKGAVTFGLVHMATRRKAT
jgi:hypothetical protein